MNVFKNDNIKVSVRYEEDSYGDNGENGSGWSIFYSIYNYSDEKIKFNIGETGLFSNNIKRGRDYYLTGYIVNDFELPPKTNITGADIYLRENGEFKVHDKFYIKLEDLSHAEEYELYFEKKDSKNKALKCISSEIHQNPILNPKSFEYKLLNSIERLDALEEKIGFRIENLSIKLDGNLIYVFGDFFMDEFNEYRSLTLNTTYYGENNSILATGSHIFHFEDFLGFESFEISRYFDNPAEIEKIRLYPTIQR